MMYSKKEIAYWGFWAVVAIAMLIAIVIFGDYVLNIKIDCNPPDAKAESVFDNTDITMPQDLSFVCNGTPIISFYIDESNDVTSIKVEAPDRGFYTEDGETYYFCINGIKVEGIEFTCATKN